jgi:hypothetical protein
MTQNGEFSALTADQAITNFSAWTGLRTNISENIVSAMRIGFFISPLLQYPSLQFLTLAVVPVHIGSVNTAKLRLN